MKQTKLYTLASLGLAFFLGLSSCQQEDFNDLTPQVNPTEIEDDLATSIRKGNHIEIALDAEIDESSDMMRSVSFEMIEREGYLGRQQDETDDYEREYRPTVKLSDTDKVRGMVIIAKKGDDQSVHRQAVTFTVTKVTRNGQTKNILRYVGPLSMPANYKLNAGDEWYAMAIINFDLALYNNSRGEGQSIHGRIVERSDMEENRQNIGIGAAVAQAGVQIYMRSVPFISNWRPITIEQAGHGRVLDFDFKPQGALLQYDLGVDVSDAQIVRRYGIVSNVLDFSGYYDLSTQELQRGLSQADAQGWGGMPVWKGDDSSMSTYQLRYKDLSETGLSSTQVAFPWHLPVLTNISEQGVGIDESYGSHAITAAGMSIKVVDVLPNSQKTYNVQGYTTTSWVGTTEHKWVGAIMSGNTENADRRQDRRVLFFWGMPRTATVQSPQTYLFADMHDERDVFATDFDAPQFKILEDLTSSYRRQISDLYNAGDRLNAESHYQSFKPTFDRYRVDSIAYYARLGLYTKQKNARTQQALVLHQTKAQFKAGQVSHIQTIAKADLLLTEQVYIHSDGHNYSMVEVYNPTNRSVSLADYALVRLVDNGDFMAYRKPDGGWTEDLNEALILPLSFVNPRNSSPFDNSGFASLGKRGAYDQSSARYKEVIRFNGSLSVRGSVGLYRGQTLVLNDVENMLLAPHHTAVFGASGFLQKAANGKYKYEGSNIEREWLGYIRYNISNTFNCAYLIAYSDATTGDYQGGTLDFEPGEGFALIKSMGNGEWQVIDATAPIGRQGYAFPVKYNVYKSQFAQLASGSRYSMERFNGIDYPYIYPFRTETATDVWPENHWVFTANVRDGSRGSSLGRRDRYVNTDYALMATFFSLKRTPLDPSYTTYRQNIPAKM